MKDLFFNNRKYINSKKAGSILGYTNDYVSKLCREGKLVCERVGRVWYVEEDSLTLFEEENKKIQEENSKKLSEERAREYQENQQKILDEEKVQKKLARRKSLYPVLVGSMMLTVLVFSFLFKTNEQAFAKTFSNIFSEETRGYGPFYSVLDYAFDHSSNYKNGITGSVKNFSGSVTGPVSIVLSDLGEGIKFVPKFISGKISGTLSGVSKISDQDNFSKNQKAGIFSSIAETGSSIASTIYCTFSGLFGDSCKDEEKSNTILVENNQYETNQTDTVVYTREREDEVSSVSGGSTNEPQAETTNQVVVNNSSNTSPNNSPNYSPTNITISNPTPNPTPSVVYVSNGITEDQLNARLLEFLDELPLPNEERIVYKSVNANIDNVYEAIKDTVSDGTTNFNGQSLTVSGNVTANQFVGDGSLLTGISGGSGNSAFTIGSGLIYNATTTDNVGIGTTTPGYDLTVAGDINLTGALRSNGDAGTSGYVLQTTGSGSQWVATSSLGITGSGTVSSVGLTAPTGLTVSGSPVTTSGTLALDLDTGYVIPLTASTTEWATAYSWGDHSTAGYITSADDTVSGTELDGVFSSTGLLKRTGAGTYTTVTDNSTSWDAAAASTTALTPSYLRGLFSNSATGLTYNSSTGATSLTSGYSIPLTASTTNWNDFYDTPSDRITAGTGLSWAGNTLNGNTGTVTSVDMTVPTGLTVSGNPITTSGTLALDLDTGYVIPLTASTTEWANKVSSQWTTSGSNIYYTAGNVGIGTSTLVSTFNVEGTSMFIGGIAINKAGGLIYPVESTGDDLIIAGEDEVGLSLISTTGTQVGNIFFGTSTGTSGSISYDLANNDLTFNVNGGDRMFIDSSGNVGIGTTSPASKLDVWGNLRVGTSSTPNLFVNTATGKVSVNGSASTQFALEVGSNGDQPFSSAYSSVGIRSNNNAIGGLQIYNSNTGSSGAAGIYLSNSTSGYNNGSASLTINQPTGYNNGTTLGFTNYTTSRIESYNSNLLLYTSSANNVVLGTSNTERLRVDSSGNVGIATTTPGYKLTVTGDANLTGALRFNGDAGTSGYVLQSTGSSANWVATSSLGISSSLSGGINGYLARWTSASTLSTGKLLDNGTVAGVNATSSSYTFNVQGNAGTNPFNVASSTGSSLFMVDQDGGVGIGTSNPTYPLTVNGTSILALFERTSGGDGSVMINSTNSNPQIGFDGGSGSTRWAAGVYDGSSDQFSIGYTNGSIAYIGGGATIAFSIDTTGKVGIGTTSPIAKLSVTGSAGSSPFLVASSTNSRLFEINQSGALGVGNDFGTSGYVLQSFGSSASPQWVATSSLGISGGSSLWTQNGNDIYYSAGGVGIGTDTPLSDFTIEAANPVAGLNSTSSTSYSAVRFYESDVTSATMQFINSSFGTASRRQNFEFYNNTATGGITFHLNSTTPIMTIDNGAVGIGDTSPANLFVVGNGDLFQVNSSGAIAAAAGITSSGTINFSGLTASQLVATDGSKNLQSLSTATYPSLTEISYVKGVTSAIQTQLDAKQAALSSGVNGYLARWTGDSTLSTGLFLDNGTVSGINATSSSYTFNLQGSAGVIPFNVASSTGSSLFMVDQNGYVGIGTTTPYAKLTVADGAVVADYFTAASTTATSTFSGPAIFDYAELGSLNFAEDAGIVSWTDLSIVNASSSEIQSYSAQIDGNAILTIYGESNGSGGAQNLRVGIGTTSPLYPLHVATTTDSDVAGFSDASGTCTINPTTTSLSCSSDERLKQDISDLSVSLASNYKSKKTSTGTSTDVLVPATSATSSLAIISALRPVTYRWKTQGDDDMTVRYGFIAQEVEKVLPELVSNNSTGYKSISQIGMIPFIVDALKDVVGLFEKIDDGVAYMKEIVVRKLTTKELCLEEVCVTKDQLQQMLANVSSSSNGTSGTNNSGDNSSDTTEGSGTDTGNTSTSTTDIDTDTATSTDDTATSTDDIVDPSQDSGDTTEGDTSTDDTSGEVDSSTDESNTDSGSSETTDNTEEISEPDPEPEVIEEESTTPDPEPEPEPEPQPEGDSSQTTE